MFTGNHEVCRSNGVLNICPSTSSLDVAVRVEIHSLLGVKLTDRIEGMEAVNFDVKAQMEEKERRSGQISLGFTLKVGTKPNVVKYEVEGIALLEGVDEEIKKMLEVNPETQIPYVFQRVYQHVFMSTYLLATLINAPYPPSTLLSSSQQQAPMTGIDASLLAPEERNLKLSPSMPTSQKEGIIQNTDISAERETTSQKQATKVIESQRNNITKREEETMSEA